MGKERVSQILKARTDEYRDRDLHADGDWPLGGKPRYGGVTFDAVGRVLLREPAGHFDGFHWTFPKGGSDKGEHPVDTALRETLEETGHTVAIVSHIRGAFKGGTAGSSNYFYVMQDRMDRLTPRR